jgi:hypothetical protein
MGQSDSHKELWELAGKSLCTRDISHAIAVDCGKAAARNIHAQMHA